jgi:transposase
MGKNKWAVNVLDVTSGRNHLRTFQGDDCAEKGYQLVHGLVKKGGAVEVIYEAGRNGFTPARKFAEVGATCAILPVNKLQIVRTGKTAKTDGLDAVQLSKQDGRDPALPRVWVPSTEQECLRRMCHERDRLKTDIKRNNNRILSILERWPISYGRGHRSVDAWSSLLTQWKNEGVIPVQLPKFEFLCIVNMVEELHTLEKNLAEWDETIKKERERQREEAKRLAQATDVDKLWQYKGIGDEMAVKFCWLTGDFNRFGNGKKFASYIGLTPVPWQSGGINKCQGISKAGNPQLRALMIEMAWLWSRYQPDSAITRKWKEKLAVKGSVRKKAIVAMARQLAVAIFQLLKYGIEPEGAIKNKSLASLSYVPGSPLA